MSIVITPLTLFWQFYVRVYICTLEILSLHIFLHLHYPLYPFPYIAASKPLFFHIANNFRYFRESLYGIHSGRSNFCATFFLARDRESRNGRPKFIATGLMGKMQGGTSSRNVRFNRWSCERARPWNQGSWAINSAEDVPREGTFVLARVSCFLWNVRACWGTRGYTFSSIFERIVPAIASSHNLLFRRIFCVHCCMYTDMTSKSASIEFTLLARR